MDVFNDCKYIQAQSAPNFHGATAFRTVFAESVCINKQRKKTKSPRRRRSIYRYCRSVCSLCCCCSIWRSFFRRKRFYLTLVIYEFSHVLFLFVFLKFASLSSSINCNMCVCLSFDFVFICFFFCGWRNIKAKCNFQSQNTRNWSLRMKTLLHSDNVWNPSTLSDQSGGESFSLTFLYLQSAYISERIWFVN